MVQDAYLSFLNDLCRVDSAVLQCRKAVLHRRRAVLHGTFAVAVVQEQRRHSCKPRGQPCWHLLGPEGHGGRLRLLLLCLLVLSCNGHFLRRGSVSWGMWRPEPPEPPRVETFLRSSPVGSIPYGGRICGTGTESCLRDEFASDSGLYRGYWCNASSSYRCRQSIAEEEEQEEDEVSNPSLDSGDACSVIKAPGTLGILRTPVGVLDSDAEEEVPSGRSIFLAIYFELGHFPPKNDFSTNSVSSGKTHISVFCQENGRILQGKDEINRIRQLRRLKVVAYSWRQL